MDGLNLPTALADMLQNTLLRAGITVALALVVGLILRLVLVPLLHRLAGKTATDLDDEIFSRLNPGLFLTVIILGVSYAVRDLADNAGVDRAIWATALTFIVMIWGRFFLDVTVLVTRHVSGQADRFTWIQARTLPLVQFTFKVLVIALTVYFIMSVWKIDLTTWLASAGVAGIAIGFAAKDTLANFISGIFILVDAPYKVGDYINIDGTTRGEVTDIGMRSTRVLTRDNIEVTVPNAVIGNAKIINESSGPSVQMRVRLEVGVAYGSDVEQVRETLMACTGDVAHVSPEPRPTVRFIAMGESALVFQVRVYVEQPMYRGWVVDALNTRIYQALTEADIKIPFPQRDLYIKSWPGSSADGSARQPYGDTGSNQSRS